MLREAEARRAEALREAQALIEGAKVEAERVSGGGSRRKRRLQRGDVSRWRWTGSPRRRGPRWMRCG